LSPSFVQRSFLLLPRRKPLRMCSREVELYDKRARKRTERMIGCKQSTGAGCG
jgi:hypothetical protein